MIFLCITQVLSIFLIIYLILLTLNKKYNIKNAFRTERLKKRRSKIKLEFIAEDPHHDGVFEWRFYNGWFYQRQKNGKEWYPTKRISITPERIICLYNLIMQAKAQIRKQNKL